MSRAQKFAWFNLAVIGLTLVVVFGLLPFMGRAAMGGLGCLGLMGFGVLFFRSKPDQIIMDERDLLIQRRAWIVAYALFWVVFVLAAVFLTDMVYGQDGAVPVIVVQMSVACGFMFVYAVASIAILLQYAGGSKDGE